MKNAVREAACTGKRVLIDVGGEWCIRQIVAFAGYERIRGRQELQSGKAVLFFENLGFAEITVAEIAACFPPDAANGLC